VKVRIFLLLLLVAFPAAAGSFKLFSDTLDLDVGTYRYLKFRITPDQATEARITGHFSTIPENTPVELILLTQWNYISGWANRGEIDTLAVRRAESGELSIPIPDYGDFVLVVSNRGNYAPVSLAADFRISFEGTGIAYDSLPTGMTILITVLAIALVVVAVALTIRKLS
jgi:hypothetical protein